VGQETVRAHFFRVAERKEETGRLSYEPRAWPVVIPSPGVLLLLGLLSVFWGGVCCGWWLVVVGGWCVFFFFFFVSFFGFWFVWFFECYRAFASSFGSHLISIQLSPLLPSTDLERMRRTPDIFHRVTLLDQVVDSSSFFRVLRPFFNHKKCSRTIFKMLALLLEANGCLTCAGWSDGSIFVGFALCRFSSSDWTPDAAFKYNQSRSLPPI